jgi:hypothetical protein
MNVKITRNTRHYRRTINGAWVAGPMSHDVMERDEDFLRPRVLDGGYVCHFGVGDGIKVEWPDGVVESAYPSSIGPNYTPQLFPADGRLSKLMTGPPRKVVA